MPIGSFRQSTTPYDIVQILGSTSLELNVGAELLFLLRKRPGLKKIYLRGLTQKEENQQGVDFFAQLSPHARIFAFQFKAPKHREDRLPYRYTLQRKQHGKLFALAQAPRESVFYVLPFYASHPKLKRDVPDLLSDTWFLRVAPMQTTDVFGTNQSKVIRCCPHEAKVNPKYKLLRFSELEDMLSLEKGIPAKEFATWYSKLHLQDDVLVQAVKRKSPWLVRGMRVAITEPPD